MTSSPAPGEDRNRRLALLAIQVALEAPLRFSKYGHSTVIPRKTVSEIRQECERLGIDWRTHHREHKGKGAKS